MKIRARFLALAVCSFCCLPAWGDAGELARQYLIDLIRIDTTNPPGNETLVANYLKSVADREGIECELLGGDGSRLNFVARLKGSGTGRPLLMMAHSDVVPADRGEWIVDPFAAEERDGYIYGRGAEDDKNLLAAEFAVLVDLKRRKVRLNRDVILLAEADEEAGSTGIQWMIANAWAKIDAEFALNEGGSVSDLTSGTRIFRIQTLEKIPTRVLLRARGSAGHGSLPRPDNPVARLARAITRLGESSQPVRLNTTTRRYIQQLARLPDYQWLRPMLRRLEDGPAAGGIAGQILVQDAELNAMLRTTITPTMLNAGMKINVIPSIAEGHVDVRRLPNESREEVMRRLKRIINDSAIELTDAGGQQMPATEPSSVTTRLYAAMEKVLLNSVENGVVTPYMSRGATDAAFLREKGMAVYGVPLFRKEDNESRAHGDDERISIANLKTGTELLRRIILTVAAEDQAGTE